MQQALSCASSGGMQQALSNGLPRVGCAAPLAGAVHSWASSKRSWDMKVEAFEEWPSRMPAGSTHDGLLQFEAVGVATEVLRDEACPNWSGDRRSEETYRLAGNGDGLFGKEMDSDVVNLTAEKTQPVIVAKEHDEENAELWDKLCAIAGRGLGCSASLHTGSRCQHETGPWVEMGASSQSDSACEKPWELQSSVDGLRFQVVADRNFQKGEQLTFDYGHSKNIELLVSYGFVIPRNAADTVALYESGE
ncbi:hypothetical protein CYMTET_18868, partial [Cymbomonas tetramitiformis]